jgi:hypothetical protein
MIQQKEAQQLSTKTEWDLISKTFPPKLKEATAAHLKSRIVRLRRLREKYSDLYRRQKNASRGQSTGRPGEAQNARTKRKAQMFDEAISRVNERLKPAASSSVSANAAQASKAAAGPSPLNTAATREAVVRRQQRRKDKAASPAVPKQTRLAVGGQKRLRGHAAAATRRSQARRDSRSR